MRTPAHRAADLTEFLIFSLTHEIKLYHEYKYLASIFREILFFSATTSTEKKGSGATLGTLGAEKIKFTEKTPLAQNSRTKFHIKKAPTSF